MKIARLVLFTQRLITADMVLNWILGLGFTFFHRKIERFIASEVLFLPIVWRLIGIGFLLFAAWQVGVVRRQALKPSELVFAAIMAWGPVVLLTIGLLMDFPLYPLARLLLWVVNFYMLVLGGLYLYLANHG